MKAIIFYSWQSDTRAAANRTLIQDALETAAKELRSDESLSVEPVVERDTQGVPGSPDIDKTILEKIDASLVVVADVTIVNHGTNGRPAPNPNVLIELGYALKSLGTRRVILVQNIAFGGPEKLPFDLRQKRVLRYRSPEDAPSRSDERRKLQAQLKKALGEILADADIRLSRQYPVRLTIDYVQQTIQANRHDYLLRVSVTNLGTKTIGEWHVDVTVPTQLLEPSSTFALRVPERSNEQQMLLRATQDTHRTALYPNDPKVVMTVPYHVDDEMFWNAEGLFDQIVSATAYAHGEQAASAKRPVKDLQHF